MFAKLPELIQKAETISHIGKIENVIGMAMESSGNHASIGDIAMIYNEEKHRQIPVEVVGIRELKRRLGGQLCEEYQETSEDSGR